MPMPMVMLAAQRQANMQHKLDAERRARANSNSATTSGVSVVYHIDGYVRVETQSDRHWWNDEATEWYHRGDIVRWHPYWSTHIGNTGLDDEPLEACRDRVAEFDEERFYRNAANEDQQWEGVDDDDKFANDRMVSRDIDSGVGSRNAYEYNSDNSNGTRAVAGVNVYFNSGVKSSNGGCSIGNEAYNSVNSNGTGAVACVNLYSKSGVISSNEGSFIGHDAYNNGSNVAVSINIDNRMDDHATNRFGGDAVIQGKHDYSVWRRQCAAHLREKWFGADNKTDAGLRGVRVFYHIDEHVRHESLLGVHWIDEDHVLWYRNGEYVEWNPHLIDDEPDDDGPYDDDGDIIDMNRDDYRFNLSIPQSVFDFGPYLPDMRVRSSTPIPDTCDADFFFGIEESQVEWAADCNFLVDNTFLLSV